MSASGRRTLILLTTVVCAAMAVLTNCGEPTPAAAPGGSVRTGANINAPSGSAASGNAAANDALAGATPRDPAARALLDRIVEAESALEYSGWRSVVSGPRGESRETRMFVARYRSGQTLLRWERSGAARDADGAGAVSGAAGGAANEAGHRFTFRSRFPWVRHSDLLLANYSVSLDETPSDPVAWRPTRRVFVRPHASGVASARPSLELIVDAETWLVLAESYRDASGREVRSHRFETIAFGPPDLPMPAEPAEPLPCVDDEGCDGPAARRPESFSPLDPTCLPTGFRKIGAERISGDGWLLSFSDGLAALTIRQMADGACGGSVDPTETPPAAVVSLPAAPEVRRSRWGDGVTLATRMGGVCVFVSGNVPDAEVEAVLRGLERTRSSR